MPAQDTREVNGLHDAFDLDGHLRHRTQHRDRLDPVARPIPERSAALGTLDRDGPVDHLLALEDGRRQAEALDNAAHGRVEAIGRAMRHGQPHRVSPLK